MHIFIAHSNEDKRLARELAEKLRAQDVGVFLDEDSLPAGDHYDARIRAAIGACKVFVFLVSPASTRPGAYALTELGIARRRWPNPAGRVLPVIAGSVNISSLPPYLTQGVTVFTPVGNAAAESANEVMRLLRENGFDWQRWKVPLAGAAIAALAILAIGASSLAQKPVSSPERLTSTAATSQTPVVGSVPEPPLIRLPISSSAQPDPSGAPTTAPTSSLAPRSSSTTAASSTFPLPKRIEKAGWRRLAADTFAAKSTWFEGKGNDETSTAELRIVEGRYRFAVNMQKGRRRWQEAPYRTVVDFYAAVNFKLVSSTVTRPTIGLLFGKVGNKDYSLVVSTFPSGTYVKVVRYDGAQFVDVIPWTAVSVRLGDTNRMGVLVENSRIQLFINAVLVGEQKDSSVTGGKVALSVEGDTLGSVVVDFGNFELRVPPD